MLPLIEVTPTLILIIIGCIAAWVMIVGLVLNTVCLLLGRPLNWRR